MTTLPAIENTSRKGLVFDIRKYSVHDGPGIRTAVFFKGCPLRCIWCHNPEGLESVVEIAYRDDRCIRCGSCLSVCEQGAISQTAGAIPVTDRKMCIKCGVCTDICYTGARESVGKEVTLDQVMTEVERDIPFFDESGGGVTLTGGEPLLQADFAHALLQMCKQKGIHTTLDTCGYVPRDVFDKICAQTDLILYDLKIMDEELHSKYTGVSNDRILQNLIYLSRLGRPVIIRVPLIPGINDDYDNIHRIGSFVSALHNIHSIEVLPYHELGFHKYQQFLKEYTLSGLHTPGEEQVRKVKNIFTDFGLTVTSRNEQYD